MGGARAFICVLAVPLLVAALPARAQDAPKVPYTVKIEGLKDSDLKDKVEKSLSLVAKKDEPPSTLLGLEQRARSDRQTVRELLRSEGYYAGQVSVVIPETGTPPVPVVVRVTPGPAYKLARFDIKWVGAEHPALTPADLGIEVGKRSRAGNILQAQQVLFRRLAREGWPFAVIRERRVVVDHRVREVRVTLNVNQRRRVRYGRVEIRGGEGVDHGLVRRRIRWRRGARYSSRDIEKTQDAINSLDVFETVSIRPDEKRVGPNGEAVMVITLRERKPRSVAVSVFFDTSLGPGAEVEWLHRNLFGGAERLTVRVGGTIVTYGGRVQFRKPDIFKGNEDLVAEARYLELNTPAYDGREAVGAVALEWRVTPELTLAAGPVIDWSRLNQDGTTKRFVLGGVIATAKYDRSDSLLDPTRGYRLNLVVAPYAGEDLLFGRIIGRVDGYIPLDSKAKFVLGLWARYGIVVGEDNIDLPATKRLFAGGGGSIRGYGFQRVGPLDSADNPTGGRSLFEFGAELRYRISQQWGAVVFAEGGTVSRNLVPDAEYLFGVGVGLRFYSPVGVIRLDLATPLIRRRGDSIIQFYISIGQAF